MLANVNNKGMSTDFGTAEDVQMEELIREYRRATRELKERQSRMIKP
jgi:hypothetical protein